MRLAHLDLLAYGKFTDRKLAFPQATHDFHVIIGPNEAGKSTLRRAITELLFGMELRSPLAFKHAMSDLRLAGVLESGGATFPFVRTKQQKSLRTPAGEVLQDSYLAPALGALRQETFEELHCLDHGRLLKGGQGIVDPKNSVSQILFQAASGLEDFTAIREALGERAAALFAKGGRNNLFVKASEKLTTAQKTLREVQVRTKSWVDARDALAAAEAALEQERTRRRELELQRTAWDRARRLGVLVDTLARLQREIDDLGEVIPFVPGTRETLEHGIEQIASATARRTTREEDLVRAQAELAGVQTDDAILQEAAAIASLGVLCGLHPNHARDLPVRRAEVEGWLADIVVRSTQFGWGQTEEEVRARLPQDKVVRAIDALLKTRGGLLAEERAAREALEERQAAVDDLQEKSQSAQHQGLDAHLVEALELALPFKTSASRQKALASAAQLAQATADNALAALGRPGLGTEALRAMRLPSIERVNGSRGQRQDIVQAAELARSLAEQSSGVAAQVGLKLAQFQRSHQVVTVAEVTDARRERDAQWHGIKAGAVPLAEGAPRLDVAIRLADELGDSRTRSEADAGEVQALRDQIERADSEAARHQQAHAQKEQDLAQFDAQWSRQADAMGLPGIALDDLPEWLVKRDSALQAADAAWQKHRELELERDHAAQAKAGLSTALAAAGLAVAETLGLAAHCSLADDHIKNVKLARERHADLLQRLEGAQTALRIAGKAMDARQLALRAWEASWREVLGKAHLAGVQGDVAEVEAAIQAWDFIRQRLDRVDTTRSERIATMEADLARMQEAAAALAHLAPELSDSAPERVFETLKTRLDAARRQADRKAQAQKYLDEAKRQRDDANSEVVQARRHLEPLLQAAGVADPMEAVPLVERWRAREDKLLDLARTRAQLEEGCDGLSLPQIQAEVASHPPAQAAEAVMKLKDRLGDSEGKLTALVAEQLRARQAFDRIDGGDQAAVAEAQRHEALAEMCDVSEDYLQLATANSLLKWAVDRYRDRKQGPLLERASLVFKHLTRGSFQKLRVDFEQAPPALVAYRSDQQPVKVAGLSDGTRDQLFLALRIAALELQAEQGAPVPFIADDLFINFDDQRSQAGLQALYELSTRTQVLFLSHQEHLLPVIRRLFPQVNLVVLEAEQALA